MIKSIMDLILICIIMFGKFFNAFCKFFEHLYRNPFQIKRAVFINWIYVINTTRLFVSLFSSVSSRG